MKNILKSQDLWDLVERGYTDPDEENRLRDNKKKNVKALVFIQQAFHDSIFHESQQQLHRSKVGPFCRKGFKEIQRSLW